MKKIDALRANRQNHHIENIKRLAKSTYRQIDTLRDRQNRNIDKTEI